MRSRSFGEDARHESLSFTNALDLDRRSFDNLLDSRHSLGELLRNCRDDLRAASPDASCERDGKRKKHNDAYQSP